MLSYAITRLTIPNPAAEEMQLQLRAPALIQCLPFPKPPKPNRSYATSLSPHFSLFVIPLAQLERSARINTYSNASGVSARIFRGILHEASFNLRGYAPEHSNLVYSIASKISGARNYQFGFRFTGPLLVDSSKEKNENPRL